VRAFDENAATSAVRRVVAALAAHDFDALEDLFAADYVEEIQRPGQAPIPRAQVLPGLRMLVESVGGSLTMEPITTLGDRFQLHYTRITVPNGDGEANVIEYASVVEVDVEGRLLRTEAFEVDRMSDATARLHELGSV
jgi:hypothetical protein